MGEGGRGGVLARTTTTASPRLGVRVGGGGGGGGGTCAASGAGAAGGGQGGGGGSGGGGGPLAAALGGPCSRRVTWKLRPEGGEGAGGKRERESARPAGRGVRAGGFRRLGPQGPAHAAASTGDGRKTA